MVICPDCGNREVRYKREGAADSIFTCWRCDTVFTVKNTASSEDYEGCEDETYVIEDDEVFAVEKE